ncbi:tetratricopeptide repeat protein [bacterium]|nr:MAG: tetratricopeptide repeat protein [bacterium]
MDHLNVVLPKLLERRGLNSNETKSLNALIKTLVKKNDADLSAEEAYVMGYLNEQDQRYQKAVNYYDISISKNEKFEASYNNKGLCLLELNQPDDALACFDKALTIDESYTQAILGKAKVLRRLNDAKKAVKLLETLHVDESFEDEYYAELSAAYDHAGNAKKALESINKAIEAAPKDANFLAQRALIHLFDKSYELALKDFSESQKIAGVNYITQFNLGLCYAMIDGHDKDAHQQFHRSFNKYPGMLKDYYKTATKHEVERLNAHIESIVSKLDSTDASIQGKFYRDELSDLLKRKLEEVK